MIVHTNTGYVSSQSRFKYGTSPFRTWESEVMASRASQKTTERKVRLMAKKQKAQARLAQRIERLRAKYA